MNPMQSQQNENTGYFSHSVGFAVSSWIQNSLYMQSNDGSLIAKHGHLISYKHKKVHLKIFFQRHLGIKHLLFCSVLYNGLMRIQALKIFVVF